MPVYLQQLVADVSPNIERQVKGAVKDHRDKIREALALHTRMTLRRYDDDLFGDGHYQAINIGVAVRPGLPVPLLPREQQVIDDQYRMALLLGPYRRDLLGLRDHGKVVAQNLIRDMQQEPAAARLLNGSEASVDLTWRYAQLLVEQLEHFQLTKFILKVNEDVLGIYDYSCPEPKIELYWGVIGLVARDLDVTTETLSCVVLAHELAHAFTHVGSDANHLSWNSSEFKHTAHEVKEGLAQYFTELVCRQIKLRGVFEAYQRLLEQQPQAYRVQLNWNTKPENVRLALMKMRRAQCQERSLELFQEFLADAAAQLDRETARRASTG